MIMGTAVQYLSRDYFKMKVSERVCELFGEASVVSVKHFNTYALVSCSSAEGRSKHTMIDYAEFIPNGQYGLALKNLKS